MLSGLIGLGIAGCGSSDSDKFANDPRPPVPTQLTGVITNDEVTVSPDASVTVTPELVPPPPSLVTAIV